MRGARFWLTLIGSLIAVGSVLSIASVWIWNFKFGLPASADKVTRLNTVVAASAYIAAIIAVAFALIAYWQASGLPSLEPKISFLPFNSGSPVFGATLQVRPPWVDTSLAPYAS